MTLTEIRDVIGDLRSSYLEVTRRIDELRLTLHLLEWRMAKLENPSAASTLEDTQSTLEDPSGNSIDSLPRPTPAPAPTPSVGQKRKGRKSDSGDLRG